MIKASDLRRGNLALFNDTMKQKRVVAVAGTVEDCIHVVDSNGIPEEHDQRYFDPIPLTEEWLVMLGLEDTNNGYRATGSEVVYQISFNDKPSIRLWRHRLEGWVFENWNHCRLNYVHQFQNLYHVLTGEELQIKEV